MGFVVVPAGGLEPPCLATADFESAVSTISPRRHFLKNRIIQKELLK